MLGNLIMFASGDLASSPSSAKAFETCCSGANRSGKIANTRPDNEMSLVSTSTPAT